MAVEQYIRKFLAEQSNAPTRIDQIQNQMNRLIEEMIRLLDENRDLATIHRNGTASLTANTTRITSRGPVNQADVEFVMWRMVLNGIITFIETSIRKSTLPKKEAEKILDELVQERTRLEGENRHTRKRSAKIIEYKEVRFNDQ